MVVAVQQFKRLLVSQGRYEYIMRSTLLHSHVQMYAC